MVSAILAIYAIFLIVTAKSADLFTINERYFGGERSTQGKGKIACKFKSVDEVLTCCFSFRCFLQCFSISWSFNSNRDFSCVGALRNKKGELIDFQIDDFSSMVFCFFVEKIHVNPTLRRPDTFSDSRLNIHLAEIGSHNSIEWICHIQHNVQCGFYGFSSVQHLLRALHFFTLFAHQRRRKEKENLQALRHNFDCGLGGHYSLFSSLIKVNFLILNKS